MRIIDSNEVYLEQRFYDDINPELDGYECFNQYRYRLIPFANKEMAEKAESPALAHRNLYEIT